MSELWQLVRKMKDIFYLSIYISKDYTVLTYFCVRFESLDKYCIKFHQDSENQYCEILTLSILTRLLQSFKNMVSQFPLKLF